MPSNSNDKRRDLDELAIVLLCALSRHCRTRGVLTFAKPITDALQPFADINALRAGCAKLENFEGAS